MSSINKNKTATSSQTIPKAIYKWFMDMFVDSYDWVIVPNVYSMSQHADGGMITTKPYFSGSAYIRKMYGVNSFRNSIKFNENQ